MTASLSTLAAVAWSDLAEASQQPPEVVYSDELPENAPVTLKPFVHHEPAPLEEALELRAVKRKAFGRFEGY